MSFSRITLACPPCHACPECPGCPGPDYSLVDDSSLRPLPPQASLGPSSCFCYCFDVCVCSFHYADSLPICVFEWVGEGGGPRRTKEGKEECSRTSVTRRFRVPGPKTVANFWGPHDVSTLLLPVFGILLFYTAKNAKIVVPRLYIHICALYIIFFNFFESTYICF